MHQLNNEINYAIALTGTGKLDKAASIYEKLIKTNNTHKELMYNYAVFLVDHQQKNKEALDYINRLKFVGTGSVSRNLIKDLETRAKAGLK